jgi:hypothetical protein
MKTVSDLIAPAAISRKLLEKDVQKQCVAWARSRGYWARKFSSPSQRSVPDYLFARAREESWADCITDSHYTKEIRIKFATEFKAPGKTSTDAQLEEQELMREAGWYVFECDDFEKFKQSVLDYEKECCS